MGRIMIVLLTLVIGLAMPGFAAEGNDSEAVLGREDGEVAVLVASDDDDGDTNTGNAGNGGLGDSNDTTAERSRSLDRSGDHTGNSNGPDRSRSKDRSRDNTRDHSRGVTTDDS